MRPFWISIGITAGQFAVLTFAWFMADRFFPSGLFFVLGTYLLLGPVSYLYQAYIRQQRFDIQTQAFTYLLGHAVLLMTLGFVWQCRIQVLRIGIPLVVYDPPWMTALLLAYVAAGGALSYLMVLLSGRKVKKDHLKPYLAPSHVTNPLLKGIIQTGPRQDKSQKKSK